jgi:hypothetical protein
MKGSSRTFENELTYHVRAATGGGVDVDLRLQDKKTENVVTADFVLDGIGDIKNFKSDPPDHQRAKNFARRWLKPQTKRLDTFTVNTTLEIPPIGGRTVPPVKMVYDIKTSGIVKEFEVDGEKVTLKVPCLAGEGTFRQEKGESIGIRGDMLFYALPNGIGAYSDVKMRFKKKISGIKVVGHTRDRMRLNREKSVVHPAASQ